jgi:PAS domain S-box-containing protein
LIPLSWVTAAWSAAIAACVTIALQHVWVWVKDRPAVDHLMTAAALLGTAGVGVCELLLMRAATPEQFGFALRWVQLPVAVTVVALIVFVQYHLRAGRQWLFWVVIGTRVLASLVVNFLVPGGVIYSEVLRLHPVAFFGETVSTAEGIQSPWILFGRLGTVLMLTYFVDAAATLWRRGDRRRSVVVCGSMVVYAAVAVVHVALIHSGRLRSPYLLTFAFLGITAAMSYELASDVLRARSLAESLRVSEAEARARLDFETLLSELSSRFVNLPAGEIDREIGEAQRRICQSLDLDLAVLWQWSAADSGVIIPTHVHAREGLRSPAELSEGQFPWIRQQMLVGRLIAVSSLDDLPAEAAVDRESGRLLGIKSNLTLPLSVGGEPPVGALALNSLQAERDWPDSLVKGLQLVGQVFTNALARQRHESALQESEERLRLAIKAASIMIWVWDVVRDEFWLSPETRALRGFATSERVTFERYMGGVHPDDRKGVQEAAEAALAGKGDFDSEHRFLAPAGERWVSVHGVVERDAGGRAIRMRGASLDITARKAAEADLLLHREELAHLSRVTMVGELSGSLAHELNQPLTAILSNAQAAQRHLAHAAPDLDEVREILKDIVSEDKRAGEVIRRLRLLLRKGEVNHQPLDLSEVVEDVLKITRSDLVSRGVAVAIDTVAGLPAVAGDRVQLQQVLLNLVVNGCDAMTDGAGSGDRRLTVRVYRDDVRGVRVSVSDLGSGIPAEKLDGVFAPFFTTKAHGLGLGLAVCHTIIEAHGGRIWAENNAAPPGTTFHFTIPFAAERA